uniref:Uncharacterized protein n=1 Tax=Anopheles culicifacies TaxID=139723 RepID=A0A182LZY0_9DIPT
MVLRETEITTARRSKRSVAGGTPDTEPNAIVSEQRFEGLALEGASPPQVQNVAKISLHDPVRLSHGGATHILRTVRTRTHALCNGSTDCTTPPRVSRLQNVLPTVTSGQGSISSARAFVFQCHQQE